MAVLLVLSVLLNLGLSSTTSSKLLVKKVVTYFALATLSLLVA